MFEPGKQPRVFACPPGADFPRLLVDGLVARMTGQPPEAMARVQVFVNTRRMQRRMINLFDTKPALFLPNIRLITDLAREFDGANTPVVASALRRRLELSQLISGLLDSQPDLAPRAALFDLADSLALLLAEMHDEGVSPDAIRNLDVTDKSGHWQRSQMFLNIVNRFFDENSGELPDETACLRDVTCKLTHNWQQNPPESPVIVAGSTGSRGTTAMLMQAIANLPQGALVLPGYDFDLPPDVWSRLNDALSGEDHPQYRFGRLLSNLNLVPDRVELWRKEKLPTVPERNRLVSLALRPAPVTNQWMTEGPAFENVARATQDMTLIEAASPRAEAVTISLVMRHAAQTGKTVALVTPDRMLTRQVTASLERWGIEPDVSAGKPLSLSTPGRLLLHIADLLGQKLTAEALLVLLKHPLVNSDKADRGRHLLWTRQLELSLRRNGPPFPTPADLTAWANRSDQSDEKQAWANWVARSVCGLSAGSGQSVQDHLAAHLATAFALIDGPSGVSSGMLWEKEAGQEAQKIIAELTLEAQHGGHLSASDYASLFRATLSRGEVREPIKPHPNIMIWGTLEARVQGADLVILGGLNEGVWPESPSPDPWLNRQMRIDAGLLIPERRIGLSAHDFQQAVGAKQVVLSRALRDAESETVPSRWVNRLTNLLNGMSDEGRKALEDVRARGDSWLDLAVALEMPSAEQPAETRPSPQPPVEARPRSLSVTAISRLIRDPYAIYAQNVLRLKKLDSLRHLPDAPLRGIILHNIMERFIRETGAKGTRSQLLAITDEVLATQAPWPASRILWRAKLERVVDQFLKDEHFRQSLATPVVLEELGSLHFRNIDFTLTAKADRIDRADDGSLFVYDYKTGTPPSPKQLKHFDKQLLLEAVMAQEGAFDGQDPGIVTEVAHIGLGAKPKFVPEILEPGETERVRFELLELIGEYMRRSRGYTSRRAMANWRFDGDYDHLARFGEWDETETPDGQEVG